jgi:hypothetical protein
VGGILRKFSGFVLVIWVVIGVSLATLYPITQTINDRNLAINSGLEPLIEANTSQSSIDSNSDSNRNNDNSQPIVSFKNSASSSDSTYQQGNPENNGNNNVDDSENKYRVNNFLMTLSNFTAEINNFKNKVTGDGFYEIKNKSSANHQGVLQNGTFAFSTGKFNISSSLNFVPQNNTKYYIRVYTNYPGSDNRADMANYTYLA